MASVQARRKPAAEKLLTAVKHLSAAELREFERNFAAWLGQNGTNRRDEPDEEDLLAMIQQNSGLPKAKQRRLERLRRKRQSEHLAKREEKELQMLWQRVEQMNVERLRALAELARQRGTDVKTLMRDLGIAENPRVF